MKLLHFDEILGRKLLIVGDVGSGKTAQTAKLLAEATAVIGPNGVTVIDMAPERRQWKGATVGGHLTEFLRESEGIRVLLPSEKLYAPRLEGSNANEVASLATRNARVIKLLLEEYSTKPTTVLFMNDVSMYLQAGSVNILMKAIARAKTVVANSYEGTALEEDRNSGISKRERDGLAALKAAVDHVLTLGPTVNVIQSRTGR